MVKNLLSLNRLVKRPLLSLAVVDLGRGEGLAISNWTSVGSLRRFVIEQLNNALLPEAVVNSTHALLELFQYSTIKLGTDILCYFFKFNI